MVNPPVEQRGDCERQQTARLGRGARREPTRHAEQSTGREAIEEQTPAFNGVQPVLGQRECTSPGRCPRIDQGHLQDVESLVGPAQVRAGLPVDELNFRPVREVRKITIRPFERSKQVLVDLDAGHRRIAAPEGRQNIAPTPNADDADVPFAQVIWQRRDVVRHPPQVPGVAVPLGDGCSSVRINQDPGRRGLELLRSPTGPPVEGRPEKRWRDDDVRVGVPGRPLDALFVQAGRFASPENAVLRVDHADAGFGDGIQRGRREEAQAQGDAEPAPVAASTRRFGRSAHSQPDQGEALETIRARGGHRAGRERDRRDIGSIEQRDDEQTTQGRTEKICRIQATGRPSRSRQGQRHRDAGKQERQSEHDNGEYDRAHLAHLELLEHGNAHDQIAQVHQRNG